MYYNNKEDLPVPVKKVLPEDAQKIYLKTFNKAWEEYKTDQKRLEFESPEEVAFKAAWESVKQEYEEQEDGTWVKK